MAKPNFQDILLKKGDKIALGVGAALVGGLSLWGVANFATADSPTSLVKQFDGKAGSLKSQIAAEGSDAAELPAWVMKGADKVAIDPAQFPLAGSPFETVDQPDKLRNNPKVLWIDDAQFDYIRFPMRANDIRNEPDGSMMVGVKATAAKGETDPAKLKQNLDGIGRRQNLKTAPPSRTPAPLPPGGRPGFTGGPGGGGMPGFPGGGGMPGGGMRGGMPSSGMPGGMPGGGMPGGGGGFDGGMAGGGMPGSGGLGGDRNDQTVRLVSPATAAKEGLTLAETIYPLRAVVVTATFPVKKQVEEIRQALRAKTNEEAVFLASVGNSSGPVFAGFEVDRRVMVAGGTWSDWTIYDHKAEYLSKIYSRAIDTVPDSGYLTYFVPPADQEMVYPLPVFADGLGEYRKITMPSVVEQIGKLTQLNAPKLTQSELEKKLSGIGGTNANPFAPLISGGGGGSMGGSGMSPGGPGMVGPGMSPGGPGMVGPGMSPGGPGMVPGRGMSPPPSAGSFGGPIGPGGGTAGTLQNQPNPIDAIVDHTLLRFIDSSVQPGYSYQYRVKVKMRNPNFNKAALVSKPADAKAEILEGPWQAIPEVFTVPTDNFLYAHDSAEYVDSSTKLIDTYGKESAFKKFLEIDDVNVGKRAVVEVQEWRQVVRLEGGKVEPVGTWVVAKMPVGPGEYIGKRQFLELPLWSGGLGNYVLRELAGGLRIAGIKDPKHQPRGWPLNLRTANLLIDFDGGKTKTRVNDREVADEAESELLILQPDGKLVVRNSGVDTLNRERKDRDTVWTDWIARVKERRDVAVPASGAGGAGGSPGGFGRPGSN